MSETATMAKHGHLTPAQQSAILSRYPWTADGKIRVLCQLRTEPLLKLAGVHNPRPLDHYCVPVRRDSQGFLVIDGATSAAKPPVSDSDYDLYEPGGLLYGKTADPLPSERSESRLAMTSETAAELAALGEIGMTRTFEIPNGSHHKVRVQILAFEDMQLPSPGEPDLWKPVETSDQDIRYACSQLADSTRTTVRPLDNFEKK